MRFHSFHNYPSTYLALIAWVAAAFTAQPTIASLFVHFFVLPIMILLVLWLAHWEGRNTVRDGFTLNERRK